MKHVKLGLIGLGEWPRQAYLPLLKELEDVDVVAGVVTMGGDDSDCRIRYGYR